MDPEVHTTAEREAGATFSCSRGWAKPMDDQEEDRFALLGPASGSRTFRPTCILIAFRFADGERFWIGVGDELDEAAGLA